ncbi:hypothetical protein GD1_123 [Paraglaciecola Antarctic GD virus 1]|nr:hypothetical protein GD1_123 [Paraglaciecola Antarctic GD virus 1]
MITNLQEFPISLLNGGTPKPNSGLNCTENASDLIAHNNEQTIEYWNRVVNDPTIDGLINLLEYLSTINVSIGGRPNRGSVYTSKGMSQGVMYIRDSILTDDREKATLYVMYNMFPRIGGLREAIIRAVGSPFEEQLLEQFIGYP